MSHKIQSIRGMHDILPSNSHQWQRLEFALQKTANQLGYKEIRTPIMESLSLFQRSIGEETDVVGKEMYHFADRNGDDIALRPEATASCVRAMVQHALLRTPGQKVWYNGPMFRHERPQRGRTRQFHQFGLEAYGISGTSIECELLMFCQQMWHQLGIDQHVELTLNTLGTHTCRARYKAALVHYFQPYHNILNEAEQQRLLVNPLRILDSKNPAITALLPQAPKLFDHLAPEEQDKFRQLCDYCSAMGIRYRVDPYLVRGLDYYNGTVFEWVTQKLGAQGTICAGGRYDQLVDQLSNQSTPATGFAMGLERIIELMPTSPPPTPEIYLIGLEPSCQPYLSQLAQRIMQHTSLGIIQDHIGGSAKNQFKRAAQSGATLALIIGPEEMTNDAILVKSLATQTQLTIPNMDLLPYLAQHLGEEHDHT